MKLSGEATFGLLFEVVVGILEHLHIHEPVIIWGLFLVGMLLVGDTVIRGDWAEKIGDLTARRRRRFLGGVAVLLGFVIFGYWVYGRTQGQSPTETVSPQPPAAVAPNTQVDTNATNQREPKAALKTPQQANQKQAGHDNAQTGSITQGPGSIAQIGGEHNSATVNNYAPLSPKVVWRVEPMSSSADADSYRLALLINTDRLISSAQFTITCNAPCTFQSMDMGVYAVVGTNRQVNESTWEVGVLAFNPNGTLTIKFASRSAFKVTAVSMQPS